MNMIIQFVCIITYVSIFGQIDGRAYPYILISTDLSIENCDLKNHPFTDETITKRIK